MDIQEYISSGVLELYVLDQLSIKEKMEVDTFRVQYPEIEEEIRDIESTIIAISKGYKKEAPSHLQFKIASKLTFSDRVKTVEPTSTLPKANKEEAMIKTISNSSSQNNFKWLAAASLLLLAISGITNVYLYEKYNASSNSQLALKEQSSQLLAYNQLLKAEYDKTANRLAKLEHPQLKVIPLNGVAKTPECHVTVYWNAESGEVMAMANNLPSAPAGKQYCLWAIKDGKPVCMGKITNIDSQTKQLITMKSFENPEEFAVTMENMNDQIMEPAMETMMVHGKV